MIMQIQMTTQIADIMQQTENMTLSEKQNLFRVMLEKFGEEKYFDYKTVDIPNGLVYILPFIDNVNGLQTEENNTKRQFGILKGGIKYMAPDFNEALEDFND